MILLNFFVVLIAFVCLTAAFTRKKYTIKREITINTPVEPHILLLQTVRYFSNPLIKARAPFCGNIIVA